MTTRQKSCLRPQNDFHFINIKHHIAELTTIAATCTIPVSQSPLHFCQLSVVVHYSRLQSRLTRSITYTGHDNSGTSAKCKTEEAVIVRVRSFMEYRRIQIHGLGSFLESMDPINHGSGSFLRSMNLDPLSTLIGIRNFSPITID